MAGGKVAVMWFRKGLRLHDNPALLEAVQDASHLYPIFILDPHFLKHGTYRVGVNRYHFLLQSLADLDASFRARGSRLLVLRGTPEEVLPRVLKQWGASQLCFETDTEPYAIQRDARVRQLATEAGVTVSAHVSHTLYDTEELISLNGGKAPLTMQSFTKLVDRAGKPPLPASDPPAKLPGLAAGAKSTAEEDTSVPTVADVGFKDSPTSPFKGGESEALARLERSFADAKWIAAFDKPQTDPSAFTKPATTVLSPYLKFGCLSPRLFYARLMEVYAKHPKHSQPPVSLRGQLLWREFFYTVGSSTPNFNRMAGNSICRQIDWDDNPAGLEAWCNARTGFPWIDAIMTQLKEQGWIHHLARHSVACFLTRGDLYVSWERGMEVFEELLLDADHFLNAANWQWLSASAFFSQYFRVYSPVAFGKKYDPEGKYIKKFLPVLKDMPSKFIYEPWLAPRDVQERAKCIIGSDYPRPIVDHGNASKACISRIAAAYRAGKDAAGDDGDAGGSGANKPASKPRSSGKAKAEPAKGKGAGSASKGKPAAGAGCSGGARKRQKTMLESGITVKKKEL